MEDKTPDSSGFGFWDKMVRNPLLSQVGVDIAKGFELSNESSEESEEVGGILEALQNVFGIGNRFTSKDVFLAIADERAMNEAEIMRSERIRKGIETQCSELRDVMVMRNAKSPQSLKSTGRVIGGVKERVSGEYRLASHVTKSKSVLAKYWVELADEIIETGLE